jgi:hypothetical protein
MFYRYELAPEQNLVLYDCIFDKVEFSLEYNGSFRVFEHFKVWMNYMTILRFFKIEYDDGNTT